MTPVKKPETSRRCARRFSVAGAPARRSIGTEMSPPPASTDRTREGLRATLASCRLFDGLPSGDLDELAALARPVKLAKGATLFHEGEASRGFYIVQTGVIVVSRVDMQGREQVIHRLQSGDSFAEASMTAPTGYPAQAVAPVASTVLLMPKPEFLAVLARRPELALRIMASMSRNVRALVDRLHTLQTQDAGARLARHLIEVSAGADSFTLTTSRRVLAAHLGMAEETLSRAFARLASAGLLVARARRVTLADRAGLARLASA